MSYLLSRAFCFFKPVFLHGNFSLIPPSLWNFQDVILDAYKSDLEEPSYLLVTHGGLIKVLFIYLFETLDCTTAPNCQKGDHRKSPRNTTWTQFVLETQKDEVLSISCETMFYSDHLDSMWIKLDRPSYGFLVIFEVVSLRPHDNRIALVLNSSSRSTYVYLCSA